MWTEDGSGHGTTRPGAHGARIFRWCLADRDVDLAEVTAILGRLAPTAQVVVVADTCYAAAFARTADVACTLVLLAACTATQTNLSGRTSDFAVRLAHLVDRAGPATDYRWLDRELRRDTPDAQRPLVWVNRPGAWSLRPFAGRDGGDHATPTP